jgi:hypothetical protein
MFLKLSSSIILFLVAPIVVAGGASVDAAERSLQASLACLAVGGTVSSCCPEGADPNDGACTVLSCLDGLSIREGCKCSDIETACEQVAAIAPDMCDMVGECCADDGTTTTNVDWEFCMAETSEAANFTMSDFTTLIAGPVVGSSSNAPPAPVPATASGGSSKYAADAAFALISFSLAFLLV